MTWKAIGAAEQGTLHVANGLPCQDALQYKILQQSGEEVLVCCMSDGAGSAQYAADAAKYATNTAVMLIKKALAQSGIIQEELLVAIAEEIREGIDKLALQYGAPISEFYCTLLGCIIFPHEAFFFQVGDGCIVRYDDAGFYNAVWWPIQGEYYNLTEFITDEDGMQHMRIVRLKEEVQEVALFTDGLQLLTLNFEQRSVHQPFFNGFFHHLRRAQSADTLAALNFRLSEYLRSGAINDRTDDDKTLFLATRLER
jgi:hypothetical protein